MSPTDRIERSLEAAFARLHGSDAPPRLVAAMRGAVFPAGGRFRPRLTLAIAEACGDRAPALAAAAAASIELLHCASLVHDDLPCFDDAASRRGRPSIHRAHGEALAVLAGDALITLAFEHVARARDGGGDARAALVAEIARGVGPAHGIIAGQGWESEPAVTVSRYHRLKTGALFETAAACGALASGAAAERWRSLGRLVGEAFQIADDIRDAAASAQAIGKPAGRDAALGRPTAASYGLAGAANVHRRLIERALRAVPPGERAAPVRAWVRETTDLLDPVVVGAPPERAMTG